MAPIKSSLARSAKQLLGLFNTADFGLRGATQQTRESVPPPVDASGGTKSTSGLYTIHTFTSSGSLVVSSGPNSFTTDFLVIGGGGGGSGRHAGGGGAGGYRTSMPEGPGGPSPSAETALSLSVQTYTVTVGTGGAGGVGENAPGNRGNPSSFAGPDITTITSEGGGGGMNDNDPSNNLPGGSGGGGTYNANG